jgi:DNA polymerase-3 subunit gamma/tau
MKSLANQKRPATFSSAIGEAARINGSIIRNQVRTGKTAHAYLFDGLRGSGKTTTARTLAKAVNCLSPVEGEPCGCCENCRKIESGEAMDVKEIDAARNNGVDFAKSIEEDSNYRPVDLKKKVYILDECHCLSSDAFSSLLKLVETPPEWCIFIFCTTDPQKVPVTIRSRCQEFRFKAVSQKELVAHLMGIADEWGAKLEKGAAEIMARHSEGSVRDAVMALETCMGEEVDITEARATEILGAESWQQIFMVLDALCKNNRRFIVNNIDRWYSEGRKISDVLSDCILAVTDKLRSLAGAEPEGTETYISQLRAWEVDENLALGLAEVLKETYEKVRYSPDKGILTVSLLKAASGKTEDLSIRLARAEEEIRELKDIISKIMSGSVSVSVKDSPAASVQRTVPVQREPELETVALPPAEAFETDFFDFGGGFAPVASEPAAVPVEETESVDEDVAEEETETVDETEEDEQQAFVEKLAQQVADAPKSAYSVNPLDDIADEECSDEDFVAEWTEPAIGYCATAEEEYNAYADAMAEEYADGFCPVGDTDLPECFVGEQGYISEQVPETYEQAAEPEVPQETEQAQETVVENAVQKSAGNSNNTFNDLDDLFAQINERATNQDRLNWQLTDNDTLSGIAALCKRIDEGDSVIFLAPNAEVQNAMKVLCAEANLDFVTVKLSA